MWEVPLLSSLELDVLQPDKFHLATLYFDSIGFGDSLLGFSQAIVSDGTGANLFHELGTGQVSVAPVPEPSTFLLLVPAS